MIKDRDLLVLSDDWGRHPSSCQHIIKKLLPFNRVLWVNTTGYRSMQINRHDLYRAYGKIMSWFSKKSNDRLENTNIKNNLFLLNPVCIPFGRLSVVRKFNTLSVTHKVKKTAINLHIKDLVVITTLPTCSDFIGRLGEFRSVYYCVDDFSLWPGVNGDLIKKMEKQLLLKVDLVIATSEKLCKTRNNRTSETRLLTHGVDVEHFRAATKPSISATKRKFNSKIVAYYGLIDERCDLTLLHQLSNEMPDVIFLIIGPWRVKPGVLTIRPNVCITGPVDYDDLPRYLSFASALILPYVVNGLSESLNPLKLKEYIATGLPVVATSLPEAIKLNRYIHIAYRKESFSRILSKALNDQRREGLDLNDFLYENSWQKKAEEFCAMVEEIL